MLGVSTWLNPFEWSGTDWAAVGVLVTVLVAAAGAIGKIRSDRRKAIPHLVFSPLELSSPDDARGPFGSPRPGYPWTVGFHIQNTGPGIAFNVMVGLIDPTDELAAEIVTRPALIPGEHMADFCGLRGMHDQSQDPDQAAAERMFHEGIVFAFCWDARGKRHLFFPQGRASGQAAPWSTPHDLMTFLSDHPSRGDQRFSLGTGPRRSAPDAGADLPDTE